MTITMSRLVATHTQMLVALRAVIGHGYCEQRHPAGQDLVNKDAIAQVRAVIARVEGA